jgi:hypothetical protein
MSGRSRSPRPSSTSASPLSLPASQPAAWKSFLASLSSKQKHRLLHKWRGWRAWPKQLAPPGIWRVWLILAGRGFDVTPDAGGWRWGLELHSYGFPGQEHGVEHARANAGIEKLSYQWDSLQWDSLMTEWFVNGSRGLEHGFTLASRPGTSAAALTLHLAVRGTLTPRVSPDGRRVSFLDDHGAPALNYTGLKVTDAQGLALAARSRANVMDCGWKWRRVARVTRS